MLVVNSIARRRHLFVCSVLFGAGACSLILLPDRALFLETTEANCSDGVDNDEANGADCEDPNCAHTRACDPCGDGALDPGETCDDGNEIAGDGCDPNCRPSGCGNGFLAPNEQCLGFFGSLSASFDMTGLSAGDFDGDGSLDLAVGEFSNQLVSIFLNDDATGEPVFSFASQPVSSSVPDLAAGDVTGDGEDDILVPIKFTHQIGVIDVIDAQTFDVFQGQADSNFVNEPFGIAAGDMNKDGALDICTSNFATNNVSIFLNLGGAFDPLSPVLVSILPGSTPERVTVGDINGDSFPDIATGNTSTSDVTLALSQGTTTYTTSIFGGFAGFPVDLVLGDLSGDGLADLVVANTATNQLDIFLSDGVTLVPVPQQLSLSVTPGGFSLSDIDKDGDIDIITASYDSSFVHIFFNEGAGRFADDAGSALISPAAVDAPSGNTREVIVGDLNGDGFPDLATLGTGTGEVHLFLNTP